MKKGLLMLGAAAMMLASCTQNEVLEVSESRAIGFNGRHYKCGFFTILCVWWLWYQCYFQ